MDDIVSRVGDTAIDTDVNHLAARHCEDLQVLMPTFVALGLFL